MTMRNLDALLHPRSIAVIGGSDRAGSLGTIILDNLVEGGFSGLIQAVNPRKGTRGGVVWCASIAALPQIPDLAVVAIPAASVPKAIAELGERGARVAVVISAGIHEDPALRQAMLDAAQPYGLRIIGPNGLGVLLPHAGINASFSGLAAAPGRMALISQSGAIVTAMLDWAADRQVGFSGVVSVGDMSDVDLGDLIDLFAADPHTGAILLYVEGVTNPAKFMSAARAASRTKPVIAIKAGRSAGSAAAAMSHTGAITGAHDVALAAFRRAGIVVVDTLTDLFDAAEVLAHGRAIGGNRIAIVSNGGGPAILAEDRLPAVGASMASFGESTLVAIDAALGHAWSRANPADLGGDSAPAAFAASVKAALADDNVDVVLALYSSTGVASGAQAAAALVEAVGAAPRVPVIGCWVGPANATSARAALRQAPIASFESIEGAVAGIGHLIAARTARALIRQAPAHSRTCEADLSRARAMIVGARGERRTSLTAVEAKSVLTAYGIPVAPARFARSVGGVESACGDVAAPYVVKVVSPQISHKLDVGGVIVGLETPAAATDAAESMRKRIGRERPEASIIGYEIEPMIARPHAQELIVGIARDETFGPYLIVGAGGSAVEVIRDRAVGLPPLDAVLARDMIERTRIGRLLHGYRAVPAADIDAVVDVLLALSALAIDFPEVAELDINPLVVNEQGVIALDARIAVDARPAKARLVIRPVPVEWTADLETRSGLRLHVRPVVPDDDALLAEFFHHVGAEDLRFRFLTAIHEVGPDRIAAMTQIDYQRSMNFLAFAEDGTLIATAMLAADPDLIRAEVALSVHQDFKRRGVSWTLMEHVLRYARAQGIQTIESVESADNRAALVLEHEMGFTSLRDGGDSRELTVRKWLTEEIAAA